MVEGANGVFVQYQRRFNTVPYRRTTIIIDGGECLVGEEGDRNVYVHTRNHSVVSLATDEIVLNVFWNKLIEKKTCCLKAAPARISCKLYTIWRSATALPTR